MFSDSQLLILEGISATSITLSFIAGILTFLSPCILPLLPIYLSYISGISIADFQDKAHARSQIITQSLAFVLGFSIIFLLIGATMIRIFSFFFNQPLFFAFNQPFYLYQIAGIVIIIFGLHITHIITIPFLNLDKRIDFTRKSATASLGAAFLLGISFGCGWSPCIGPILSSIVLLGASDPNSGLWLLILYTIGLAIPFLLSAWLISSITQMMARFKPYMGLVEKITGILLILMGIMVMLGYTGELSAYLIKHYNFI